MPHIIISPETVFTAFGLPVTNTLLLSWIVVLVIIFAVQMMARRMSLVPHGFQNAAEYLMEAIVDFMGGTLRHTEKVYKYLPFVTTFFVMILISNWIGLLPGVGSIGFKESSGALLPIFRSPATDLNFTLALTIVSLIAVNAFGIISVGIRSHLKRFFNFSSPLDFFTGLLELLSEAAKLISLSFRLFGNVFAGEVLLIIMGFLSPFIAPVPFLILELFFGAIQALIFAALVTIFIGIAVEEHG